LPGDSPDARTDHRYRWYCDACSEAGEWQGSAGAAQAASDEHAETHAEPLYGSIRIQRYPAEEVEAQ
jgi:hypothetical protein